MTIIKGLIYTDGEELLRPQFSGEFYCVDCDSYKTVKQIRSKYDKATADKLIKSGDFLTYEGKMYFRAEYSPYNTQGLELLSDIDEIEHFDETQSF